MRVSRRAVVTSTTAVALAVLVLGPALFRPGYVLVGDMVFVPDPPWKVSYLGLDGSLPRAVPTDALVWLLSTVVPGWVVQKMLLLLAVVLAVVGVQRLLSDLPAVARVAASVAYVWTPYTHDRLAIGQWSLLVSIAALPWVALAARRPVDRAKGATCLLAALLVAAIFSPSGGVMAAAAAVALVRSPRERLVAAGLGVAVNLPWLVPGFLSSAEAPTSAAAVEGFAARAESAAGLLPSLLAGGGIWKTSIVAPERSHAAIVLVGALVAVGGLFALARRRDREVIGLGVVALLGLGLCLWTAAAPETVSDLLEAAPGLGIFRDTTRYLAPLSLLVALGWGTVVAWMLERPRHGAAAVAVVLVAVPPALLPSLAWAELGDLRPVDYPKQWYDVRAALQADPLDGPLVVRPWQGFYRRFDWNLDRAALDPAPRFFPGDVLVDDRVLLDNAVLPNEDPRARRITQILGRSDDPSEALREAGVAGVLTESPAGLELERLGGAGRDDSVRLSSTERAVVLVGDLILATLALVVLLWARSDRYDRPTREREPTI